MVSESEKLANRMSLIEESSTIKMAKLSRELKEQGIDIISLNLGEPDFTTPIHIVNAAKKAMDDGFTHYAPVAGFMDLRIAIANKFKRDNNLEYKPENIVVSNGAKQSLINVMLSVLNPMDEVIIPAPYWVSYPEMVKFCEAKPVFIKTGVASNFKITPSQLESAITEKTRLFLFSNPSNPTGSVYTEQELRALAEVFKKYPNILIISDEIYELITFDGGHFSIAQIPEMFHRSIVVNGVSKAFAMTGWRIGYLAAPLWIAKACEKIQSQFTSAASSISQKATVEALNSSYQPTYDMRDAFKIRRDIVVEALKDVEGLKFDVPDGSFYLFPEVYHFFGKSYEDMTIKSSDDLCMFLLKDARVSLVGGEGFGSPECFRISFAASEQDLKEACRRIKSSLLKLK